jgi:hypothetical protein
MGVPELNRDRILSGGCAMAFDNMSLSTKDAMQATSALRKNGQWLVAAAAFCQIVSALEGTDAILERLKEAKDDPADMRKRYEELEAFLLGRTNAVEMPEIAGKQWTELEKLYVRADTWEGGGRPSYISCDLFIKLIGHCIDFS